MALSHSIALGDDGASGAILRATHVWLQFGALHFTVAVNGVNLAIVVEEHAEVVDVAFHVVVLPRSLDVLCGIALQSLAIDVGVNVELSVGIADAGCPNTLTVDFLVVFQRETVFLEVEAVEAIGDILPVHQVLGVEDDETGDSMHGCTCQVVVVAYTQDVGIAELVIKQGIGECSVSIIGSPRGGLCMCTKCHYR